MAELQGAKKNEFGKRVLGDAAWQRQQDAKRAETKGGVRFGKRVVEDGTSAPVPETKPAPRETKPASSETKPPAGETTDDTPPPPSPFGKGPVSVAETEKLLTERPELFDDAYAAEMMAPQPRKSALDLLLRIERGKPSPRAAIIKGLDAMRAGESE